MNTPSLPVKIIICAVLCIGLGAIGGIATSSSLATWYPTLNKPFFQPPNWIFAPMWTTLYLLMGIAAALVWHEGIDKPMVKKALTLFGIQFILNMLWSWLFFGLQNPLFGLIEILILWVFIFLTVKAFFSIKKISGWLLIPYILWVTFAAILNFSIWQLNM